jgi:c-di-GMP-binding flagellar brake protein YcgR
VREAFSMMTFYSEEAWPVVWLACGALGLFALGVVFELTRRRLEQKKRIQAEWDALDQVAREKELSTEEWELLRNILADHAPHHPFKAATVRRQFDRCVEEHLDIVARHHHAELLEQRGVLLHDIRTRLGLNYIPLGLRIHSTRELYHHQVLWVALKEDTHPQWLRMAVTMVDEAHFYIASADPDKQPGFSEGQVLRFRMWRDEDARYLFSATITREEKAPHIYMLRHARDLKRMQARSHFRIIFDQPVSVGIINAPVDGDVSDLADREVVTKLRGRTTSLSGGGLAVLVDQPVPRQVWMRIEIALSPEVGVVEITASIVGVDSLTGGRYLLRGAFMGMEEETREAITHYVSQQQQPIKNQDLPAQATSE